jgi:hypothetical protein
MARSSRASPPSARRASPPRWRRTSSASVRRLTRAACLWWSAQGCAASWRSSAPSRRSSCSLQVGGGAAAGGGGRARVQGGEISGAGGSGAGGEAWSVPGVADSSNHQAWCLVPVLTRRRPLLQHTRPHAPTPQPPPPPPGLREYAAPIIDAVDPSGSLIAARIFREGTTRSEHYQCVKDMARVGRPLSRTVLVDDTPLAFLHQPGNGVPVLGFRGDPDDRLLAEAVLPLLQVRAGPSARAHRRPPPASRRLPRGSCAPLSLALPLHRPASSPAPSEPAAPSPPHRSPDARRGARRAAAARAPLRHG